MKPPAFAYVSPRSVSEAVAMLQRYNGEAKLLAGGQSLVPLLNFRMLRPSALVDLNRIQGLDYIVDEAGGLRIGAMTRHHTVEMSALVQSRFPVLAEAMTHVAHLAIRNRGTFGGSLAHADPAAELPMLAVLLDAEIVTVSATGAGRRAAKEFFLGPLTTALADDEVLTEVYLPAIPTRTGSAFAEFALRHGDFAIAAVAATLTAGNGKIGEARLAVTGVGDTPLRLCPVEILLNGQQFTPELAATAAEQARDLVTPNSDLRGSADYRRHLVAGLTERVLHAAWARVK
jgi:CO/xanthine dehydrogenase FAD-binding subunit